MTDITQNANAASHSGPAHERAERPVTGPEQNREALISCIELFFFAYRDFTGEPDAVLAEFGFGRAHHRVLHFVQRNPGIRVADLLEILKITKQSLARVLKQLVDEGFIAQRAGAEDRRERLLRVTGKGARLVERLTQLQMKRVQAALAKAGPGSEEAARNFLLAMIAEKNQAQVKSLIKQGAATPDAAEEECAS